MFGAAAAHPEHYAAAATVIGLLLFVGAIGKSAQIPLYVWLPDAMAGPTPVSALIHAATMVTAGVYMVARCNVFFRISPTAMLAVAIVGGLTAIFAATIGLAQNDIKKVLAYSTVSQLGYMFLGAGVGAFVAAHLPRRHPRLLQGLPVPRLRLGDPRLRRRAGHAQDGRAEEVHAHHLLDLPGGDHRHRRASSRFAGFFSKDEILAKAFAAGLHRPQRLRLRLLAALGARPWSAPR